MCFSKQPQGPEKKEKANYLRYFPLAAGKARQQAWESRNQQGESSPKTAPWGSGRLHG